MELSTVNEMQQSQNNKNRFPDLPQLQTDEGIRNSFHALLGIIDEEEDKLHNNAPFPYDDLNQIGIMEWEELILHDNTSIEEMIWKTDEVVRRIEIQEGRVQKILNWIDGKLAKALSFMPPDLMNYVERDVKYRTMGNHYPLVRFLLDEKDDYSRLAIHWRHLAKNMEKKSRSLWYRLEQVTREAQQ